MNQRQILLDVDEFATKHKLDDIRDLLRKGALLADDPTNFERVEGLTEEELVIVSNEKPTKWYRLQNSSPFIYAFSVCVGAFIYGCGLSPYLVGDTIQSLVKGAETRAKKQLIVALVHHAPHIGSLLIGCWCTEPLNNFFGRRGAIFSAAIFRLIAPIGSMVSQNWGQLFASRLLLGIAMGIETCTVPIYCGEISPASVRGALISLWQIQITFGQMLGPLYFDKYSAKTFAIVSSVTTTFLLCRIWTLPESPRWCVLKGKMGKAYNSLRRLGSNDIQAARDLYQIHAQIGLERQENPHRNYIHSFTQLFTVPNIRRATMASIVVLISRKLSGIDMMRASSSRSLSLAGSGDFTKSIYSSMLGFTIFLLTNFALPTFDNLGRRGLLLLTIPQMVWPLLLPDFGQSHKAHLIGRLISSALFAIFYGFGELVPLTYWAEVFPASHREVGMALTVSIYHASHIILDPGVHMIKYRDYFSYLFAGLDIVAFSAVYLFMRETKKYTLEDIPSVFESSTRKIASYRIWVDLPYRVNHYVLRKEVRLEPFDESKYNGGAIFLGGSNRSPSFDA